MKKTLSSLIIIIISFNVHAQGYAGFFVAGKGAGVQMGFVAGTLNVNASLQYPLTTITNPTMYTMSLGRMLLLTNDEADNYSLTPAIGAALHRVKNFEAYNDNPRAAIPLTSRVYPHYSLQAGKDAHLGRMYVQANYCNGLYLTAGMKVFFNR